MIFANLSWDHILGFVRVFAKKQSPGDSSGSSPRKFFDLVLFQRQPGSLRFRTDHKLVP